ncbi:unnamed protein product [Lactuca saligna]|uniref:Uncharacterized protein n=1 Tax=Lactuca saligna TaxID=75948 RepID=A0AA35YXD3_LACSI|nr:unnamed protein product [Lactuca saligna]
MSLYSSDRVMKERLWEVKGCLTRSKEALLVLDWTEEGKGNGSTGAVGGLGGSSTGLLKQLLDYLLLLRKWITNYDMKSAARVLHRAAVRGLKRFFSKNKQHLRSKVLVEDKRAGHGGVDGLTLACMSKVLVEDKRVGHGGVEGHTLA